MTVLKKDDVNKKLKKLDGWRASKKSVYKTFELKDFSDALGQAVLADLRSVPDGVDELLPSDGVARPVRQHA